jgi:hypothetical protein
MKKSLLAMAMAAMLGLFAQVGTAKAFLLQDRSPNVTAGQIIVGAGMTVAADPIATTSRPNGMA